VSAVAGDGPAAVIQSALAGPRSPLANVRSVLADRQARHFTG
jgi:hypothetical protein